jgi:hypothetical protein
MAAHSLCSECRTANRSGLLFCVVCGRRLPRGAFPPDRITAVAWPGPEVAQGSYPARPSALAWASLVAALLAWSLLPMMGAGLAVLLALRAQEEARTAHGGLGGTALIRLSLLLGGLQLALGLVAGAAMAAVALTAFLRAY